MKKIIVIIALGVITFSGITAFAAQSTPALPLKPADNNFKVLKQLYGDALEVQATFLSLKENTVGINGDKIKLIDVEPTLMQLEEGIMSLLSTIMDLKDSLLTLKPADLQKLKPLISKAQELQQAARLINKFEQSLPLQKTTPALSLKTPAQKASEEKRLKDMEKEVHELQEKLFNSPFGK